MVLSAATVTASPPSEQGRGASDRDAGWDTTSAAAVVSQDAETKPSQAGLVVTEPAVCLAQVILLSFFVCMRHCISGVYDGYLLPGKTLLESVSFMQFIRLIVSFFAPIFYHGLGQCSFVTVGFFIMAFGYAGFYSDDYTAYSQNAVALILGFAEGVITLPAGAAIATFAAPQRRVWYCGVYTACVNGFKATTSLIFLARSQATNGGGSDGHGDISVATQTMVLCFGVLVSALLTLLAIIAVKWPNGLSRADGVTVYVPPWPGVGEALFRCWAIPGITPGFLWLVPFFLHILFIDLTGVYTKSAASLQLQDIGRALATVGGNIVAGCIMPCFVAPHELWPFLCELRDLLRYQKRRLHRWFLLVACRAQQRRRHEDYEVQEHDVNETPQSNVSLTAITETANKPHTSAEPTEFGRVVGKSTNDVTFLTKACRINIFMFLFACGSHLLMVTYRFFMPNFSQKLQIFPPIYIACLAMNDAVKTIFGLMMAGYLAGNDVVLATYYIGFYRTFEYAGSSLGWILNRLVLRVVAPGFENYSLSTALIRWALEGIAFFTTMKALAVMSRDLTPVLDLGKTDRTVASGVSGRSQWSNASHASHAGNSVKLELPSHVTAGVVRRRQWPQILSDPMLVHRFIILPEQDARSSGKIVPTDSAVVLPGGFQCVNDGKAIRAIIRSHKNFAQAEPLGQLSQDQLKNNFFFLSPHGVL